ncbi:MAG TPA: hypothetical protein VH969_26445 [Actinophytocola sp.]|uniref:hypothetical protein n=1 Tax=Actinophytocola sp. TaxID=1872138 RepID=UPI002F95D2FE
MDAEPGRVPGTRADGAESHVDLRPVPRPRPPIHPGGTREAALRRIGRRADGWLPGVLVPHRRPRCAAGAR